MPARLKLLLFAILTVFVTASCANTPVASETKAATTPEFRVGVWLNRHEMQKGDEAIVKFLDAAKERGINTIYANVWFHGAVIYPNSKMVPQHGDFVGRDPLALVIREGHARGMTVMPWAEYGFFTHYNKTGESTSPGAILEAHPGWALKNSEGGIALENTGMNVSHYSLNPGNAEARKWLADLFLETAKLYPQIDGFHVDRIRYMGADWGYDEASLKAFEKQSGYSPKGLEKTDPKVVAWNEWREAQTTAFMKEFSERFRKAHPGKTISGAVVPPYLQPEKFQRWDLWAKAGYIDEIAPMLYGGEELVTKELARTKEMVPVGFPIIAGIDAAMGADGVSRATKAAKANGAAGVVLWGDDKLAGFAVETFK